MSRGRLVLLGIVLAAAALWALRGPIALRVMERALARNMGADPVAALPDGLHVLLCGAGGPLPDPVRSGPCTALIAGRTLVVVDAGTGGARNLQRLGFAPGLVDALFLTHFHSDHIDGLGEMAMLRWTGGGHETPLPVHGPAGVEEVVDGFGRAYRQDAAYRVAHHGAATVRPSGAGMTALPFAPPAPGEAPVVFEADGLRVIAFAVEHEPIRPAVGYRFEYGGRTVVVSGDTKKSALVEAQARGVDLLVHEALARAAREALERRGHERRPREHRQDRERHPRLSHHAGGGGGGRAGRGREAPALHARGAAAAGARPRAWCSSRAWTTPSRAASRSGATAR